VGEMRWRRERVEKAGGRENVRGRGTLKNSLGRKRENAWRREAEREGKVWGVRKRGREGERE